MFQCIFHSRRCLGLFFCQSDGPYLGEVASQQRVAAFLDGYPLDQLFFHQGCDRGSPESFCGFGECHRTAVVQ